MKRFKENNKIELENQSDINLYEENKNSECEQGDIAESLYKRFEDEEERDDYINPSMKKFRKIIGGLFLVMFIFSIMFSYTPKEAFRDNLTSGAIENVVEGDLLSKKALKLDPKNATLAISGGVGNLEISIWNFSQVEDNDYVQVFIDGVAQGAPFSIRHKPVKVSVPDKGVIQVQGVRDGSNNGITYAVFFNKTGETYLNTVPLNTMNTYTIVSK
ncbi:hypothetical protein GCM10008904_14520 [Paraclostridium ghonii]|uniref:Uncharacterized protein n=1 Tax=Paraclostridium ghonii TaxID=29358 RepID=A0ABU0MZZ8_9FIRM|nr:hypothetical protein [Paeniclostridium ghonii]MDQ0556430.1 hypothetical protein [Paeniclostridium ghonii]